MPSGSAGAEAKALVADLHSLVSPSGERTVRRSAQESAQEFASLCTAAVSLASDQSARTALLEEGIAAVVVRRVPACAKNQCRKWSKLSSCRLLLRIKLSLCTLAKHIVRIVSNNARAVALLPVITYSNLAICAGGFSALWTSRWLREKLLFVAWQRSCQSRLGQACQPDSSQFLLKHA